MKFLDQLTAAQHGFEAFGSLDTYDEAGCGPLLGVSDSGVSAALIVEAIASSAKIQAGGAQRTNGLILDAERMGSAGEVPVGPDEYASTGDAALGKAWYTTNVGVRANARHLQARPELPAAELLRDHEKATDLLAKQFEPFLNPPGGRPRPLTVLVAVTRDSDLNELSMLGQIVEALRGDRIADASLHRVGLLTIFDTEPGDADVEWAEKLITAAAAAGIQIVAFDGPIEESARIRVSGQGLLQLFDAPEAARLLTVAAANSVTIQPRFMIDVASMTRTIWTGLYTARAHGLSAAKYGLTPLTLPEQRRVIADIQKWTEGWTAIPAFYADTPLVTDTEIFLSDRVVDAAMLWLEMVYELGVRVALFDCPDRFVPRIDVSGMLAARRLIRTKPDDDGGAFTIDEIEKILVRAKQLGVRILWSGGITPGQAFDLASRSVSGIFTTSSTAVPGPVTMVLAEDPRLARENMPTRSGVWRVHALIQAGFLRSKLSSSDPRLAQEIETGTSPVLSAQLETPELGAALTALDEILVRGWAAWRGDK